MWPVTSRIKKNTRENKNMSKNPYPIFSVSSQDQPEHLQMKIKLFIRLYSRHQAAMIADAIVQHLCALLAHNDFNDGATQRCLYRALEMHWRCLAWNARN